jgi:hypothetical protein
MMNKPEFPTMKTKFIQLIMLCMIALIPAAIFAQDSAPAAAEAAAFGLFDKIPDIVFIIATWYAAACTLWNGLVILIAAVVKKTPGDSDDKAVDKFYASKYYKAVAWLFSWGDYIGEFITKPKK